MQCPICGSEALIWRLHGQTPILRCTDPHCGFRFFDLSRWNSPYVVTDYYADWQPAEVMFSAPWIEARVKIIKRLKQQGDVAELGCGIGETAIALSNAGYRVVAVEESEKAINFLRKRYPSVDWRNEDVLKFLENNRTAFDVVTLFHVLEHIPHPKRVVELVDASLRPNGIVVVEVPDVGGGWARLRGAKWDYYIDHHVNYFDVKSMGKLFGLFGYRMIYLQKTYHFSFPQGHFIKDVIKGALGHLGLNSIIRTVWTR